MIEDSDDIGWHWDKDYGMEAQGVNVHPCLATVTYLSTNGGPTVILEKRVSLPLLLLCRVQVLQLTSSVLAPVLFLRTTRIPNQGPHS